MIIIYIYLQNLLISSIWKNQKPVVFAFLVSNSMIANIPLILFQIIESFNFNVYNLLYINILIIILFITIFDE